MSSCIDRNPVPKAYLRAERVNDHCLTCGNTCTSSLCDSCQSILNFKPKSKRLPKLLDYDERELMDRMQAQLKNSDNKQEIQNVIDFLVDTGRERFQKRRIDILKTVSDKEYECQQCGRPITHFGYCLSCNKAKKNYRYRAAEKDRD